MVEFSEEIIKWIWGGITMPLAWFVRDAFKRTNKTAEKLEAFQIHVSETYHKKEEASKLEAFQIHVSETYHKKEEASKLRDELREDMHLVNAKIDRVIELLMAGRK